MDFKCELTESHTNTYMRTHVHHLVKKFIMFENEQFNKVSLQRKVLHEREVFAG